MHSDSDSFPAATRVLEDAIAARVFPGAVVEIGRGTGPVATISRGSLTYAEGSAPVAETTIYDLASLTKVLATAAVMVAQLERDRMRLNDRVSHWIDSWTGEDRQDVTIRDLLEHCSGLPGHRHYFETRRGRASYELAICEEPLEYEPRTKSIYSDPGFMLLGFAIENAAGAALDRLFDRWRRPGARRGRSSCGFVRRPNGSSARRQPKSVRSASHTRGVVHDENAAALDGVAGPCRIVRHGRRRRRLRALVAQLAVAAAILAAIRDPWQLTRARVGHDAADLVVRNAAVARGHRSHRIHGNVAVARSRAGSLCRVSLEPRPSDARPGREFRKRAAHCTTRS